MTFLWPLISITLVFACSTEINPKKLIQLDMEAADPIVPDRKGQVREVQYHCSESASRSLGVLYMRIIGENGTSVRSPARISGMIPMMECRSRSRSYFRNIDQIPGNNYFCELDASGTAMLFEQSRSAADKLALSTKKISKAMSRRECTDAAKAKQIASGMLWQES